MATTVYYFTGTGNSLAAARTIGETLGDCTLIPLSSLADNPPDATKGVTGLVFPLYFSGLPEIVVRFAGSLDTSLSEYTFAVVTRGGGPSRSLNQLKQLLTGNGGHLDAGFILDMPGNYTPMYDVFSSDKQSRVLDRAGKKLGNICRKIAARENHIDRESIIGRMIGHEIYHTVMETIHTRDSRFSLTEGCTSCGICANVCPVGNVTLEDGLPVWGGNCQQCFSCFHFCAERVIQFGSKTGKRGRYHHPEIRFDDISRQRMGMAENYQ